MSKVVVTSIVSVDGYTEGPGGNVMVMPMDHAFDEYNAERMRTAGSLLFGATTYRGMVGFWPSAAREPRADPGQHRDRPAVRRRHPDHRGLGHPHRGRDRARGATRRRSSAAPMHTRRSPGSASRTAATR